MNNEKLQTSESASTSPEYTKSTSSGKRPRSNSLETVVSSVTAAESNISYNYPGPPVNSPETQSLTGDVITGLDTESVTEKLRAMPVMTPPTSDHGVEGKACLRSELREDVPFSRQLFKQPPKRKDMKITKELLERGRGTPTPTKMFQVENMREDYPEHSTWAAVAEEDVTIGLKRLAMLARDEHKKADGSVSVEEYYSLHLARLLKEAEYQFDPRFLQ